MEASEPSAELPLQRDVVVVGASAGGVEVLERLASGLPADFPAAVLIVLHVKASGTSVLPQILARHCPLSAAFAAEGEPLRRGQIYVAPADHHMLVRDGAIHLTTDPRENGHRPSIDALFRSAADDAGQRVIGVVVSGFLDDGAAGLRAIKEAGGVAVVQDPHSAAHPAMPEAAMKATEVDHVVPAENLAALLGELVTEVQAPA
jgi:two-component system chemotaxis response regulator CheB